MRDRSLYKTVRLSEGGEQEELRLAREVAAELGFDPDYYVSLISEADRHRSDTEETPKVVLETGELVPSHEIEPLIAEIIGRAASRRSWIAVPEAVKKKLGRLR